MPALAEVTIEGGVAKTTANTPGNWVAKNAFIQGHAQGWFMGAINGEYGRFPQMFWYEFPADKTFVPTKVSFNTRQDCDCNDQIPTIWQFIGSNDEDCQGNLWYKANMMIIT